MPPSYNSLGQLLVQIGFDPSQLASGASAVESQLERVGTRMFFLGSRITAGFSGPLAAAVGVIAKFGLEFDDAMNQSLAIMDKVSPQMKSKMEQQAMDIVNYTRFSSTEGAKAYYSLASAGLDAAQAVEALPVAARFAQAGMFDLGKATDLLTGVTAQLGLKSSDATQNMINMTRVSDVLTEVNNRALGTIKDYATALENGAGAQLRLFSKTVEEGTAVLGAYAEQGILGAKAGQALYMVLRDLSGAALKHKDAFDQAGISVFDANGKMRNMADIVQDLEKKFGPLSDAGRRAELQFLGLTDRASKALLPLIGMSERIRELQADLENAGGATQRVSDNQMKSLQAQLESLWHQLQNVAEYLFKSFYPVIQGTIIPTMQDWIKWLKGAADYVAGLTDEKKKLILEVVAFGIAIGPVVMALGSFTLALRAMLSPVGLLFQGLNQLSQVTMSLTGASGLVGLLSNPWILGGAALIGGLAYAYFHLQGTIEGLERVSNRGPLKGLIDDTGQLKYTLEEAAKAADVLDRNPLIGGAHINVGRNPWTNPGGTGTASPDVKPPKTGRRDQSIFDRVSGKQAIQDAKDWLKVIYDLGGAYNLTSDDAAAAEKVFSTALDHMAMLGQAATPLAAEFRTMWEAFFTPLDDVKILSLSETVRLLKDLGEVSNDPQHTLDVLKDRARVRTIESGRSFTGPIPGIELIPGSSILRDAKKWAAENGGDFQKEWAKAVSSFGNLSSEFGRLAKGMTGSAAAVFQALANVGTEMQGAGRGGISLKTSWAEVKKGGDDLIPGIAGLASGALQVAGAFMAATNSGSMLQNTLGGIMTGASAGAAFGPWGAAIGAAVGGIATLIKGKPEWAKAADDIGRDMGVHISDKLAQTIADDAKKIFGGDRLTAEIYHLGDIIKEGGGLNPDNLTMYEGKLRDVFSLMQQGHMNAAQAQKVLNDNFADFVKAGTDGYGFIDDKLKEIISLNDQFGTQSKAITDFLQQMGNQALTGFGAVAKEILSPFTDLHSKITDAQDALDKLSKDGKEGTQDWVDAQKTLDDLLLQQKNNADGAKQSMDDLGIQAVATYAAAVAAGMSESDALKKISPQLKDLAQAYKDMGINVDDAALKALMLRANIVESNPQLMAAISGLSDELVGLSNMGLLNVDTFAAMERTGKQMYDRLLAKVQEFGGGDRDALAMMQDYLHKAEKAAQDLGVPLDDNTQKLIDQSKQLGIWKEDGGSATDRLIGAMDTLVKKVGDLVDKLSGVNHQIDDIPDTVPDPFRDWSTPGVPDDRDTRMAAGGILTGPRRVVAGEAGPEAIIPLDRLESMLGSPAQQGNGKPIVVILQADGRELARTTVPYMPDVFRENGLFT